MRLCFLLYIPISSDIYLIPYSDLSNLPFIWGKNRFRMQKESIVTIKWHTPRLLYVWSIRFANDIYQSIKVGYKCMVILYLFDLFEVCPIYLIHIYNDLFETSHRFQYKKSHFSFMNRGLKMSSYWYIFPKGAAPKAAPNSRR